MLSRLIFFSCCVLLLSCSDDTSQQNSDSAADTATHVSGTDTVRRDTAGAAAQQAPAQRVGMNRFSLAIPAYMQPASIDKDASVQYMNPMRGLYLVVLEDPKADAISAMRASKQYDDKLTPVQNYRFNQLRTLDYISAKDASANLFADSIGGLPTDIVEITGPVKGSPEDLHYKIAFIEGESTLYMLMAWTPVSRLELNAAEMAKMLRSFREQ